MKKVFFILAVLALYYFTGCEKINEQHMIVVKDCTGTYLRQYGDDYKVCNFEKLDSYENGRVVAVTYSEINECPDFLYSCEMLHLYKGWIEVNTVE